ncbi:MAG: carbohydrate-binding family 9-like protein [Christensenellales bacterium]|jgi:hypothetical protein|nr:hypothetical protein [Christensenellaceae bacterium]
MKDNRLKCENFPFSGFPTADNEKWSKVQQVSLVDVETGERPFLSTNFTTFRSDEQERIFFKFSGEDDVIRSYFRLKDEPIYRADVFELYISDTNDLNNYIELEVSPHNVQFDARITYDKHGKRRLDMSYDIEGWKTRTVFNSKKSHITSVWSIPYSAFISPPKAGSYWRFNIFRIDHSDRGVSYQAWQKTGEINFHVPSAFGYLDFV